MGSLPVNFRWSFSKLETYEDCPMRFKLLYLDHVENEDNAFGEYGTLCHEVLEQHFHFSIGGYPFTGIVDLVLRNKKSGSLHSCPSPG